MVRQSGQQVAGRLAQKAGSKLMQQAANFLGRMDEETRLLVGAATDRLGARQRVLEQARQLRQVGEADRRRAAGERVCECDRRFADRPMQLHRPLGDLGRESTRQLVGLVQVDVEERNSNAQRADDLDMIFTPRLVERTRLRQDVDAVACVEAVRIGQRFAARQIERQVSFGRGADVENAARRDGLDQRRTGVVSEIEVDRSVP